MMTMDANDFKFQMFFFICVIVIFVLIAIRMDGYDKHIMSQDFCPTPETLYGGEEVIILKC